MGHSCEILTFKEKDYTKKAIQAECDGWGDNNCDAGERGYYGGGLGSNIRFTDKVFNTYEEACNYLNSTFGNYSQIAVRYKEPKKRPTSVDFAKYNTKALQDLERRMNEYTARIKELQQPHYVGVKIASVKCKTCGAVLPTAYCGKAYINNCPFCKSDLRPETKLKKEQSYRETLEELRAKYYALKQEADSKYKKAVKTENDKALRAGFDYYWAVACEVHC